jgi:hypothetical protein
MNRSARFVLVGSPLVCAVLLSSAVALAQPAPTPGPGAAPPPPAAGEDKDGVRFRGGVSAVGGGMFLDDYSGFLAGADGHLGVQVNHLIGVYLVPHLTFGPVDVGPASSVIGLFSATAVVDFTLIDHIFVGAGAGYGVVNNPTGPTVHFRAGGYPLMGRGDNGIRRKGLMLGVDTRLYILDGATVMELSGGLGYEAF